MTLRLGTRGSALALAQARRVASVLEAECEIVEVTTRGDRGATGGDKSRWVAEIEEALLAGEVDLAVHSAKDVPGEVADGLVLAGVPDVEEPWDVLCGAAGLDALAPGARVGTSSLRRRAMILAAREDVSVVEVRGNVDTRLRKLADGECDALVLAVAGLARLGRGEEAGAVLRELVPAPGQGRVLLEARADDSRALDAAAAASLAGEERALHAERALARALGASCQSAVGARAELRGDSLVLRGWAGAADGSAWCQDELSGPASDPDGLGERVAERMLAAGAGELLK